MPPGLTPSGATLPSQKVTPYLGRATVLLLGLAVLFSLLRTVGKTEDFQDLDFGAYYRAAGAAARGGSIYTIDKHGPTGAFVYAPAYAYFFLPLSYLDYLWACRLWTVLNWIFVAACVFLALRLVSEEESRLGKSWGLVWLIVLPLGSYFWSNVRAGQAGRLMTMLCLGWMVCQRRDRPFLGGVLLAAATALKLAPGLLLPYLVVRRDWRGLAGALTGGLALLAVPGPWVGCEGAVRLHLDWVRHCQNTQIRSQTCRTENQSLLAELARLPGISNGQTCYSPDRLRGLERAYPALVLVLAAIGYAAMFRSRRRDGGGPTPELARLRDPLHLSLLMIFLTLAHPRAWGCNFTALTPAAVLLADAVYRRAGLEGRSRQSASGGRCVRRAEMCRPRHGLVLDLLAASRQGLLGGDRHGRRLLLVLHSANPPCSDSRFCGVVEDVARTGATPAARRLARPPSTP